jgi:hypothetical protein
MQNLFPRAVRLYLMRLDDLWASLFVASSPPAPGLAAGIVFLRSKVCYTLPSASPRGYALRFATVGVITSVQYFSTGKTPPKNCRISDATIPRTGKTSAN